MITRNIPTAGIVLLTAFFSILSAQSNRSAQTNEAQNSDREKVYNGKELDKRAVVIKKVEPNYTKKARKHKIEGTVVLRCIFSSTGEVTNITVVSGLPDGLTERAIEAARRIKFIPAMKNGKPASMYMELEYNFHLY